MTEVATSPYAAELSTAITAARAGGAAIKPFYDEHTAETYTKKDGTFVTDADLAADKVIRQHLSARFPGDAILTEESGDDPRRLASSRCWIVDPLDGTNQFIERTGEFDVLIALVVDGRPVAGATYAPAFDLLFAAEIGQGAWLEREGHHESLRFSPLPAGATPRLTTSVWFGAPATLPTLTEIAADAGFAPPTVSTWGFNQRAFLSPHRRWEAVIGFTRDHAVTLGSEWDFAANDLIVHEAGGAFTNLWGERYQYNKPVPRNIGGFLTSADPALQERLLAALARDRAAHGG